MAKVTKTQFVRDIRDKESVSSVFLIKFSAVAVGKTGRPYMNLVLMDRTGEVECRVWDDVTDIATQAVKDAFVFAEGKCQLFQGRRQVVIKSLRVVREDEVNPKDYVEQSAIDPDELYRTLMEFVDSMVDPYYKALAESILRDDEEIVSKVKRAPAAKAMHHAYTSGLLEHVISITRTLDFLAGHYRPYVDRDLMFLGGFLHDIGKIWELSYDRSTDYTTEGRLIGHLVMGVELIERKIRELEAQPGRLPGKFPEEKRLLAKHMVLAHHGKYEYGSPKRPKCLEALLVHYIDDLDSKVNAIMRFTAQDVTTGRWTQLSRQYERYFYKPDWALEMMAKTEFRDGQEKF